MTLTEPLEVEAPSVRCEVKILVDRCAGCQECVVRCPTAALDIDPGRWVAVADSAACVGCRQCVRTCPFSAITVQGPPLVAERTVLEHKRPGAVLGDMSEIHGGFGSLAEAQEEAQRCLTCPDPTCMRGCPAHNDIPQFISAICDGDLGAAHTILRRTTVLPDVCARVCDQTVQCEGACTWSLAGAAPVAIGALERFVADHAPVPEPRAAVGAGSGMSVGIVGSGPAGIGAAFDLVEAGAEVTVYEADEEPGGLLRRGIPAFTLPEEVAGRPWKQLSEAGVDVRCGVRLGPADFDSLLERHDALVLAYGAGLPLNLPVAGADLGGVEDATTFLTRAEAALGAGLPLDDLAGPGNHRDGDGSEVSGREGPARVLVLGAGNTAMDVARCAVRLGAHAVCIDWMNRRFAPVRPDELKEAEDEGVEVRFLTTLRALDGDGGKVAFARLARTVQRRAGDRPSIVKGAESEEPVDLVVVAMGYRIEPDLQASAPGTPVSRRATGLADRRWEASGLLSVPGPAFANGRPVGRLAMGRELALSASAFPFKERTWVAGDALSGPSTVVEAMAQGRRAAQAILASTPTR